MRVIMRMRMKMSVNFEILMREDVPVDILFSLSFFEISFFFEEATKIETRTKNLSFHRYKKESLGCQITSSQNNNKQKKF